MVPNDVIPLLCTVAQHGVAFGWYEGASIISCANWRHDIVHISGILHIVSNLIETILNMLFECELVINMLMWFDRITSMRRIQEQVILCTMSQVPLCNVPLKVGCPTFMCPSSE